MNRSDEVKNLIFELCKAEHIPVKTLHKLCGIKSPATFQKRLDDPSKFKPIEIDRIAYVLELKQSEIDLLRGVNR